MVGAHGEAQLGAARKGIVGHAEDLPWCQSLPVVVATGGVLHQHHLLKVRAVLDSPLVD